MPPSLKIDIATKILDERMKVHLVRPGARYALRDVVVRDSVLPVDAPLLAVEDGEPLPQTSQIAPDLERARVLRTWARQSQASRGPRPSLDIDFYRLDLVDPSRAAVRTKIRNAANQVLWTIPGGTLVVIPSSSLAGNAILAEIAPRSEPRVSVKGTGARSGLTYPARKLSGLKKVPMRDLPISVTEAARTVKVVEKISGHAEDRILRQYYGDYQKSDDRVAGLFAGTKNFDGKIVGQMVAIHMAVEHALTEGGRLAPGQSLFDREVTCSPYFHARVDSPDGRTHLESNSVATFVVKLLMILASVGLSGAACAEVIETGQLLVENSSHATGGDMIEASKNALIDFVRISGHDNVAAYIDALQDGLNRNSANVAGTAVIEE